MAELSSAKKDAISKTYHTSIHYNYSTILTGRTLVVDPSSGGHSSLPAFVVIDRARVGKAQEIPVSPKYRRRGSYVGHRLQEIGQWVQDNLREQFDLLAIELIYHEISGSTVLKSYQQLIMSIGAIHATVRANYRLVIPPWEWKLLAPKGYKKTDKGDATLMARKLVEDSVDYYKKVCDAN